MDKVVAITGASGVLCSAFARSLAQQGCRLALIDIKQGSLAQEINDAGGCAVEYIASVLDTGQLNEISRKIRDRFGGVDILINGAGGNHPDATTDDESFSGDMPSGEMKTFFDLKESGFDKVFGLNLKGTLLPCQVFARDMLKKGGGTIINISSMNAFTPLTKIPAYSAAKAAVSNFTQWLAVYFAKQNIRVNAIAPGFFATSQNRALLFDENGNPTDRSRKILSQTPMGRFGVPDDLIGTLLWLADESCSGFVTGITVPVDGGFSAYSGV